MRNTPTLRHYITPLLLIASFALSLSACSDNKEKKTEVDIPLNAIPSNIINVVQTALPGIVLSEVEKETKGDSTVYEMEGQLINGKKYELKIAADGTIIKIELDD
jgi:uncharacterized membrane protein YkoI